MPQICSRRTAVTFIVSLLALTCVGSAAAQSFSSPDPLNTGVGAHMAVAADFNGDGVPDLASANTGSGGSASVSVFIGAGPGTFNPRQDYPASKNASAIVSGDFNGDGKADLAVAHTVFSTPAFQKVSVFLNNGDGTFQAAKESPVDSMANDLTAVDFNKDGKLDLAVVCESAVNVLLGNGDGTFQARTTIPYGPATSVSYDSGW